MKMVFATMRKAKLITNIWSLPLTGTDSSIPELKNRIEKKFGSDMAETAKLLQNNPALVQEIERTSFSLSEPVEILPSA